MSTTLTIARLLTKMNQVAASDLHIKVGSPPILRIAAELRRIEGPGLTLDETESLLQPLVPETQRGLLEENGSVDFSVLAEDGGRFRCSVFRAGRALHAAIRRVNPKIPDFNELRLPPIYEKMISTAYEGLVIVCGVTGCGKSSTLAAMINYINLNRSCNIITIEDPVEYAFQPAQSFISQREIGIDTPDFSIALRSAVRQDPDVLMIGEMRDRETMLAGIQAAETGHLVLTTLHTADTMQAFNRMLEFFPVKEHGFIRASLATSLRAVCAQRLLPSTLPDVQRVPATEVLINNAVVSERIRKAQDDDLPAIMSGSVEEGMHDFTIRLGQMIEDNWLDLRTAEKYAPHPEELRSRVRGIDVKADSLVSKTGR